MKALIVGIAVVVLFIFGFTLQANVNIYLRTQETLSEDISEMAKYIAINSIDDDEYGLGNLIFTKDKFFDNSKIVLSKLQELYKNPKNIEFFIVGFFDGGTYVFTNNTELKSITMFRNVPYLADIDISDGIGKTLHFGIPKVTERENFLRTLGWTDGKSKNQFYSEYVKNMFGLEMDGLNQGVYIYYGFSFGKLNTKIARHDRFTFSNSWE